jgi:hypothetical protein
MKATLTALAAVLVAMIPLKSARAQMPNGYPGAPAGYGYPAPGYPGTGYPGMGYPGPGPVTTNYGPGPVASAPAPGCDSCGKSGWFSKKGGCDSCGTGGCGKAGCGTGGCGSDGCGCKGWLAKCLCKKNPSTAPTLYKAEYPLGFPTHPYVRGPRDYFMWNDP